MLTPTGGASKVTTLTRYAVPDATVCDLTVEGVHTYYAGTNPVLVHNCGGPVTLSQDQIDLHIVPRHGPGTESAGTKLPDNLEPDEYEAEANRIVSENPVPTRSDPVTGNHAHDGRGIRVWVNSLKEVQTMHGLG